MASLALLASSEEQTSQRDREICHGSAQWLAAIQHSDGSLPVAAGPQFSGGWPTPLAVLLWRVLNGYHVQASRALSWILSRKGEAISVDRTRVRSSATTRALSAGRGSNRRIRGSSRRPSQSLLYAALDWPVTRE